MIKNDTILLISNAVLPNMGVPSTASGLRYYYMYKGLKELGLDVKIAIPYIFFERLWKEQHNNHYINLPDNDNYLFYRNDLQKIIKKSKASYVIFCNALLGDKIKKINHVKYVYDMFAPKMFELIEQANNGFETIDMPYYLERKKLAFKLADAFIVNGKKKIPYIYGFGLASDCDVTSLPNEIVHMAVEPDFRTDNHCRNNIAIAGAQHNWTKHGDWLIQLYEFLLENSHINLHLLIPFSDIQISNEQKDPYIEKLMLLPNTEQHGEKSYSDYVKFLHNVDLVIDVFERNIEREHAVVSRTVNAICCGIPVIHSSFTEVSGLITEYNAGWVVDEKGSNLKTILSNYQNEYDDKVEGTKTLALKEFNYKVNATKILNLLNRL